MQQPNVPASAKKPAEFTGDIINNDYAHQLIWAFKEKFPEENSLISIETSTILDSVNGLANVSGIRFMYGMESVDDPMSKVILLIPCNATSTHLPIPNTIVQPHGYLNNRGERVGLKRTWELLYNHAIHFSRLLPELQFNKIARGAFFGIQSLKNLLQEYTNAHALHYHFGWDNAVPHAALQHKPVLQPLHTNGAGYEIYFDYGTVCPPVCSGEGWIVTDILKREGSGPLVEMYYYVSPALKEAIYDTGRAEEIYSAFYHNEIRQFNMLIEEGKFETAKSVFEQAVENLVKTYLYK